MSIPLQYDFSVVGVNVVQRALQSIERRAAQSAKRIEKSFAVRGVSGMGAPSRVAARGAGGASVSRRMSETARGFDQIGRAARAGDMKIHRERMSLVRKEEQARIRVAERVARAEVKSQRQQAMVAQRERTRARRALVGRVGRGAGSALRAVGSVGATALSIGGGLAIGNALSVEMSEGALASKLANQMGAPGRKGELLQRARGVRGYTGAEALGALGAFQDITGAADAALPSLEKFSRLALATGTEFPDLMAAAGNAFIPLNDQLGDSSKAMTELLDVMQATAGMGAVGAVEMKDLASQLAGLAAQAGRFDQSAGTVIKTSVAMAQAARQRGGAASAAEAVTSVERFSDDLIKNADKFGKMGVNVWADKSKTKLRGQQDIVSDVLAATGGDLTKITKGFGIYAGRAVAGFSPLFTQAEKENAALPASERRARGEAGRAAVAAEFRRLLDASVGEAATDKRAESRLGDADLKFKEAMKNFNAALAKDLLPVLTNDIVPSLAKMAPDLAKAAELFAKAIKLIAENPWKGLGAIVGAGIVKEIAAAQLGAALTKFFAGGAGGGGGKGDAAKAAGGASRRLGLAGAGAGLLAAAGLGLAYDQAGKLMRETGGTTSMLDAIPGFKGGKFDSDLALGAMFNPFARARQATRFLGGMQSDLSGDTQHRAAQLDYITRKGGVSGVGSGMASAMVRRMRGDGTPTVSADDIMGGTAEAKVQAQLAAQAAKEQAASVQAFQTGVTNFGAAVSRFSASGGPNRGDSPTIPRT